MTEKIGIKPPAATEQILKHLYAAEVVKYHAVNGHNCVRDRREASAPILLDFKWIVSLDIQIVILESSLWRLWEEKQQSRDGKAHSPTKAFCCP